MKLLFYILVAFMLTTFAGFAQRPPSISSPEVHADNTVTFKYYSRSAQKVSLSGEFLSTHQAMTKDTSGIWSITVGPVKPDIYPYFFIRKHLWRYHNRTSWRLTHYQTGYAKHHP